MVMWRELYLFHLRQVEGICIPSPKLHEAHVRWLRQFCDDLDVREKPAEKRINITRENISLSLTPIIDIVQMNSMKRVVMADTSIIFPHVFFPLNSYVSPGIYSFYKNQHNKMLNDYMIFIRDPSCSQARAHRPKTCAAAYLLEHGLDGNDSITIRESVFLGWVVQFLIHHNNVFGQIDPCTE